VTSDAKGDKGGEAGIAQPRAPAISLPKGGGAIHGIGEKFGANPVTGTGSMSVPIATSRGRSGFAPRLSLSYDSGAGNGPFGIGWTLSLPAITRKTDKGLPKYLDAEESDEFILSGAEDLVPALVNDGGAWQRASLPPRVVDGKTYGIQRYRPRLEGLFARIERWSNLDDPADTFWRSISRENVTTWYGKSGESRIADPSNPARIFSWLICESHDDKGNAIAYEYRPENSDSVDLARANERNRTELGRSANRYPKRIRYGNRRPYHPSLSATDPPTPLPDEWLFEVVLDYGEHDASRPSPEGTAPWPCRIDAFSSYRAGFEVRTYRLCRRVLVFHRFAELGEGACLVRSTDFAYSSEPDDGNAATPALSFLLSATQRGYRRTADGSYLARSLPPLEFEYSRAIVQDEVHDIDRDSLQDLPSGVDGGRHRWLDLDGEGLTGVLSEEGGAWYYTPNLSTAPALTTPAVRFGPSALVARKPLAATVGEGDPQFLDLAGDGQLDVVQFERPAPGFYERDTTQGWHDFLPFHSIPVVDWRDPNLRLVDLTGDGHADILITEDDALVWYPSLGEAGFAAAERVAKALDEERGPRLVFADAEHAIYLADMSGDGLPDIARIRNGEVCYWPNLGYGRFGARVTMDGAPWFDRPDQFDQRRVRLADIDGSAVTDIIYLGADGVDLYFNQSGNGWGPAQRLAAFPAIDDAAAIDVADLMGNGTACLVWSSPLAGDARRPMRYVDLMGGQKPHLLVRSVNNLGAETVVHYVPSTRFYLADKLAGKPWLTRLPFPVHVVERVETHDRVSGNRFVTRYAYHHGYFDGVDREFRGFGMVEQWDTEEFAALGEPGGSSSGTNIDPASHVPPVHTKTWFHTGVHVGRYHVSDFFAGLLDEADLGEYYREPGLLDEEARASLLPDTVLPAGLTLEEEREACRALKGMMLRQEVYALDGTAQEPHPYTVTEQNFTVRLVQPESSNRHAVFFTHPREAIVYHYERNPDDPRISHALTLEVDDFGNVLKSAAVAYGRRQPDPALAPEDQAEQARLHITVTESGYTNGIDLDDAYRTPLPSESRTFELTGLALAAGQSRFELDEARDAAITAVPLPYEARPGAGALQKRLIEHVRTLYRPDDLGQRAGDASALLPLGQLESLALPGESYKLAFTPGLVTQAFGERESEAMLADECRYVQLDGDAGWWIPSGRIYLSAGTDDAPVTELAHARDHFFLPRRFRDPFHAAGFETESVVTYDDYDLLVLETRDALGNLVTAGERDAAGNLTRAGNDYRVLLPVQTMDPNRNRAAVAVDALGLVVGTAVMSKPEETLGDSLDGFEPDLDDDVVAAHLADPLGDPHAILQRATTRLVYDLFRYYRTRDQQRPEPAAVYTLARETHESDLSPGEQTRIQHSFSYSDGFGREIQKKLQAEPGPVPERDVVSGKIIVVDGQPRLTASDVSPRWVGSGWTVFNNKGKPVRQFEPFFTDSHLFELDVRIGVGSIVLYDPAVRVVATVHPNHSWQKVRFDPWRKETWDGNDTALIADPAADDDVGGYFARLAEADYLPTWYGARIGGALGVQEQAAARSTELHAATPSVAHADSLGRTFLTVAHNRFAPAGAAPSDPPVDELYATRVVYDIEGNQREVIDAKGRAVMRYDYDMLANVVHHASMDAGDRWMLNDAAGQPVRAWDARGHELRTEYDQLHRPVRHYVRGTDAAESDPRTLAGEVLFQVTEYGEGQPDDLALNLRTRAYRTRDGAGIVTNAGLDPATGREEAYDFKGNPLRVTRQLAADYKALPDWSNDVALEPDVFASSTAYDALNRAVSLTAPDDSEVAPTYNEANLLERIDVRLRGAAAWTTFVADVDYNARGQRAGITYGNGVRTAYEYDPLTFRLARLTTTRDAEGDLQAISYTYDPVGNITAIRDEAQQTLFFANAEVTPDAEYTYDAVYQLIAATGREHIGQTGQVDHGDPAPQPLPHPNDGAAMRRYTEQYEYDGVGNILAMIHQANGGLSSAGSWTRHYAYAADSNRLLATSLPGDDPAGPYSATYAYDAHGSMTRMPHLPLVAWDFAERLHASSPQVVTGGVPETTYYVYDAAGQRVRKVTDAPADQGSTPARMRERVYLGGFEIYREFAGDGATVSLERETLHVPDGQKRVAMVETKTIDAAAPLLRYQITDHLDSPCLEVDDVGRSISYEQHHPYGTTAYRAVDASIEADRKRYRHTGKERDEDTGLYYHGARYYAAWLGRWTAADPSGTASGTNRYEYVAGNPVRSRDLDGRALFDTIDNAVSGIPEDSFGYRLLKTAAVLGAEGFKSVPGMGLVNAASDPVGTMNRVASAVASLPVVKGIEAARQEEGFSAQAKAYVSTAAVEGAKFAGAVALGMVTGTAGDVWSALTLPRNVAEGAYHVVTGSPAPTRQVRAAITNDTPLGAVVGTVDTSLEGTLKEGVESAKDTATLAVAALLPATKATAGLKAGAAVEAGATRAVATRVGSATPGLGETLVGSSRSQMRRAAQRIIGADPNHPLRFLLDSNGRFKATRGVTHDALIDSPDRVQMGHIRSNKAGGPERLMLQGAWENQRNAVTLERPRIHGFVEDQPAIDIGGIAVEQKTAEFWEKIGWLPAGTVHSAPRVIVP
jgi:RHS repeat-associated protein